MSATRTVEKTAVPETGTWQIDQSHSDLRIIARHLMVAKVRGSFEEFYGTIVVAEDPLRQHQGGLHRHRRDRPPGVGSGLERHAEGGGVLVSEKFKVEFDVEAVLRS